MNYLITQILTKNNESTIKSSIESISTISNKVVIGDLGSADRTKEICKELDVYWVNCRGMNRSDARNHLCDEFESQFHFYIEPWEILSTGHDVLRKLKHNCMANIFKNDSLSKEVRVWNVGRFQNPVFEKLDKGGKDTILTIYSGGGMSSDDIMELLKEWKSNSPTSAQPYYYHACVLLSEGKYEDFLQVANHYLFIEKDQTSMSSIMIRYYYALVYVIHKKEVRPALQNLNLCLCTNPLMAEFWCLTGDVYYHLIKDFKKAKEFYENAILLGSRRLSNSTWPMEISKYKEYPEKMIESCRKIEESKFTYASKYQK